MKTLVLLSGGIDSAVTLAMYLKDGGDRCAAVGFDYGQAHVIELQSAEYIAKYFSVPFERIKLPDILATKSERDSIVFVGRNLVMAAVAVAFAQANGFERIAVGCTADDHRRFPDCRVAFWESFNKSAKAYGIDVCYPLIRLRKIDVIDMAHRLDVPIPLTWSCYSPTANGAQCGDCYACKNRAAALATFKLEPTP